MTGSIAAAQWVTASPLWSTAADQPTEMQRPTILRFDTDSFMADLAGLLTERPHALVGVVAEPRSFRRRPPAAPPTWDAASPELKLYQPTHGHFNVVAASLVCRLPGLPDRTLDMGKDESVGFVLRRLVRGADRLLVESAWVDDALAGVKGWRPVAAGNEKRLATGEEVMPLLPIQFGAEQRRRLLVGLVPTSSADTFKAAGALSPFVPDEAPDGSAVDPRLGEFETRVLEPLDALQSASMTPGDGSAAERARIDAAAATLRTEASRFLLVDFAELLAAHLPNAWAGISTSTEPAGGTDRELYVLLENARGGSAAAPSVRWVLIRAWQQRLRILDEAEPASDLTVDLRSTPLSTTALRDVLERALAAAPASSEGTHAARVSSASAVDEIPKFDPAGAALFVVRCVFRRPRCNPPLDIVSEPTRRFSIASFFDIDAPARSIRVQLPVRTSIADLRKYPKNVGFVLSDQLREQMSRATDVKKVMAGQLAAGESIDVGMLCSFSIPVITICALIVLMIFINLLNIVFWWLPFLRICLPISLRGKST